MDKAKKEERDQRWATAFESVGYIQYDERDSDMEANQKATAVLELLIQASDISHTMQHWQVYRRWNENFFLECYQAFLDGHMKQNPASNWFEGELKFFDFCVIPMANKLKQCGVFGVSSDEYLTYAIQNRKEWELHGKEVVKGMLAKAESQA